MNRFGVENSNMSRTQRKAMYLKSVCERKECSSCICLDDGCDICNGFLAFCIQICVHTIDFANKRKLFCTTKCPSIYTHTHGGDAKYTHGSCVKVNGLNKMTPQVNWSMSIHFLYIHGYPVLYMALK